MTYIKETVSVSHSIALRPFRVAARLADGARGSQGSDAPTVLFRISMVYLT